ncbi:MAG: hypothetical protein KDB27_16625 [Planctomycetales bacterium]|nr:hypothetical protein [Planctomycetales bacterium]
MDWSIVGVESRITSLSQTDSGTLRFDVQQKNAYDKIQLTDKATLAGALEVTIAAGINLTSGEEAQFELLTASSVNGKFDIDPTHHQGLGRFVSVGYKTDSVLLSVYQAKPGDANGDGIFNSKDLIIVFAAGEYEDLFADNSDWTEGDWNGDNEFDSGDLVAAFKDGSYTSADKKVQSVPEPSMSYVALLALGIFVSSCLRRSWRKLPACE